MIRLYDHDARCELAPWHAMRTALLSAGRDAFDLDPHAETERRAISAAYAQLRVDQIMTGRQVA